MKKEEKKYPEYISDLHIAAGVVIKKDGKYLLVQENKKEIRGLWNFPAGKVEKGDTILETAIKEAKEETGFNVIILGEIGVFHEEGEKGVKHAFEAEITGGEIKFPKEEIMDVKWFTLEEIKKMKAELRNPWVLEAIEIIENKKNSENTLDSWKRCQADFENYKKSQAQHQEEFRKYAKMDVIGQILPVLDNFEISLKHVPEDKKANGWVEGIMHIKRQIEDVLRNNDVEEIKVKIGDKFNPEIHEAVGGDGEKQIVKKILQKGYRINGRVLRAARVEVG